MANTLRDPVAVYAESVLSGDIIAGRWVRLACQRHLRDLEQAQAKGLVWNEERAYSALQFFPDLLFLEEDQPFNLHPFQQFIVGSLFGWYRTNGKRRFRTAYVEAGKGSGKALALNTPIATPDGWTTMGELRAGDWVFDERGQPTQVIFATDAMMNHECYRVGFSDGEAIIADAEHLWVTRPLRTGGAIGPKDPKLPRKGKPHLLTTEDIAKTVTLNPSSSPYPQAKYNHQVQVAGALQLTEKDLPIPPYVLGAWLGDGDSDCARITCADPGILEVIRSYGIAVGIAKSQKGNAAFRYRLGGRNRAEICRRGHPKVEHAHGKSCLNCERMLDRARRRGDSIPAWTDFSLQEQLRTLHLLNNKHIPLLYLRASYAQRLALLQGLLDTDGTISKAGAIEFSVCLERLALDFIELARTLGFRPTMSVADAKIQGRKVGLRYRVRIMAYADTPVFRLMRKHERQRLKPAARPISQGRMIIACDPIASVPVKCIKVANPSGLFLAGKGLIPTHNSPLAGGVGLYGLIADGEPSAEIYSAATMKEQATICFKDAKHMVELNPELTGLVEVGVANLAVPSTNSFFRPVSSEHKGLDGKRVHMALIDELQEHPSALVVDKMRAGTKRRMNALIFEITNSGVGRHSVCFQHHDYSLKVLQEIFVDDSWFAYVCTLDPCAACEAEGKDQPNPECAKCDDWRDEVTWAKANPGLGTILPVEYLREQVIEAINRPGKENIVKRLNFCMWTEQSVRWLSMDAWDECSDGPLDPASLLGRECFGGLDLAKVSDLSAFVLLFPPKEEKEKWKVLCWFWVPEEDMRVRAERDKVPYDVWVRQKLIVATDGNVTDFAFITAKIIELAGQYQIKEISFDRTFAGEIVQDLQSEGLTMVQFGQGFYSMAAPTAELERMVKGREIEHGKHPVLRWNASNVAVKIDPAGNMKPDKEKSTERIDGIVALCNALGRAIVQPKDGPSVYEERGLVSV